MNQRIKMFGFEIEGEFSHNLIQKLMDLGEVKGDRSISCCSDCREKELLGREFNSRPFKSGDSARSIFELIQKGYNKKEFHYNDTCGFHVHISTYKFPAELISMEFMEFFKDKLKEKYPDVWDKRSENKFCLQVKDERELLRYQGSQERYRMINTWSSYDKHGTIEARIWPTAEPMKMYEYLLFTKKVFASFLRKELTSECSFEMPSLKENKKVNYSRDIIKNINKEKYVQTVSSDN